jgi:hypothetical protein
MPKETRFDVFLSYAAKDRAWAEQFAQSLQQAGVMTFFDIHDLAPGARWQDLMQDALRESSVLVVLLSANSIRSPWTFFEVGAAVAGNKRIIPVLLEDIDWAGVPPLLTAFQSIRGDSPDEVGRRVAEVILQTKR